MRRDLTKLNYPMFPVTEEDKAILRKAELWYAANPDKLDWVGLCYVIAEIGYRSSPTGCLVRHSINNCIYLNEYIRYYPRSVKENNMLRRIWITKLLNQ